MCILLQIERIKAVARLVQSELEAVDRQLFKQEVQRRIQLNLCVNHPFKKKEETKMRKGEFLDSVSLGRFRLLVLNLCLSSSRPWRKAWQGCRFS